MDRTQYIGGSDIAAILALSPWKTPLQLFYEKIAVEPSVKWVDPARTKFFRRRKRQEPVIAEMLADDYGIEVTRLSMDDDPNRYVDPDVPCFAAEVDFEFHMSAAVRNHFPARDDFLRIPDGTLLNGEIKTVSPFMAGEWGDEGSEDVPVHYQAQIEWGCGVTRRPAGLCAALFGLDRLVCYPIVSDPETVAGMRRKAFQFWNDNVQACVAPDPLNNPDIKLLYGKSLGRPVELDVGTALLLSRLQRMRADKKALENEYDETEFAIAKFITDRWRGAEESADGAVLLFDGKPIGTWKSQRGTFLDQKQLKAQQPELVTQYTREHHYRVFRLTKEKGK